MKNFVVFALFALVVVAYGATVPEINNEAFYIDDMIPRGTMNPNTRARVRRGTCPYDAIADTFCRAYCAANHRGTGHCVGDGKCQCG